MATACACACAGRWGGTGAVEDDDDFRDFVDEHHGDGIMGIWCAAPPGAQAELIETEPERFYRPSYVGHRGWIGLRLDVKPDWDELREIAIDAYRQVAPKTLVAKLDAPN